MASDTEADARLSSVLDDVAERLADGDFAGARTALEEAARIGGGEHPEVRYAHGCLAWEDGDLDNAAMHMRCVLETQPAHADAHYALARLSEEDGDRDAMVEHDLSVLALDAKHDRDARLGTREELDHIEAVAQALLAELPSPFVERLARVPVVLERRPSRELVKEGFDPRALGLFEGPTDGDRDTPAPTRIVLYTNNLLAEFPEEPELSEEIEITLLHEIGHFFDLDEDDMVRLGLD